MERYVPDRMLCHQHGMQDAINVHFEPNSCHIPGKPLPPPPMIYVHLACGCPPRRFGVDNAYIDSTLRMVAVGGFVNEENELVRSWEKVRE